MTDAATNLPHFTDADLPKDVSHTDVAMNRFTEAALERHKREGLELAVKARWVALAVIAVMLPFLNPSWEMLYYHGLLVCLALVGWAQWRVGRVGRSKAELLLLFADLALMTFALVFPNPFSTSDWPPEMVYRFGNFIYFFVILGAGTLAYSWRTIVAIGTWTAAMWLIAAGLVWWLSTPNLALGEAAKAAFGNDPSLLQILDPNSINFDGRVQEVVVFLIVACTLALTVRRFNRLLLGNAALERERENLSRYFSPTMVDELSRNDDPLKQIRTHNVAVVFVDIVGFTEYAADRHPEEVIQTLRGFHGRMEQEVFRHNGTLDKYLGDGLMATFGTPVAAEEDATQALRCVRAMMASLAKWNAERAAAGEPEIRGSFGLHFGPVVLGDIGANRLEFAVIGNTVNVASRMEAITRTLGAELVVSEDLYEKVQRESEAGPELVEGMTRRTNQTIRGIDAPQTVWTL